MRTHSQIIKDAGGVSAFAKSINIDANTAKAWPRLDSIPARYWEAVVLAELATLTELARAAALRPAKRSTKQAA